MFATVNATGDVVHDGDLFATAAEGEGEATEAENPILPATNELIWGTLAFVLLFAFLAAKGYPAVKKAMDDRTNRIRSSLDEADRTRVEAQSVLADYQAQLADARAEASRIIEEARQTADAVRRDLQARAEVEIAELRQRNAEQIGAERDRVLSELSGQVKGIAIELAEKVVGANLDREANLRLIESYINSVEGQSAMRGR